MSHLLYFIVLGIILLYGISLIVPTFYFIFKRKIKNKDFVPSTFVSVLVPVRNEETQLVECLESLLKLNYPDNKFELLLINDHSTDQTRKLAERYLGRFPLFKIIDNPVNVFGKKSALTLGVQAAKGELIVTTDGDCILPSSWLLNIVETYETEDPVFIAGPVAYKKQGGLLRNLLAMEQIALQIIAAGSMQMGLPILCSGANLAYKKDFFIESGGYQNDVLASGDDVFLMLKAHQKYPGRLRFMSDNSSIVLTSPAENLRFAIQQRSRWLSKISAYGNSWISGLGILVFLCNCMPLFFALLSFYNSEYLTLFFLTFAGKMLVDVLLLSLAVPFYREPRLLLFAFFGEIVYPFLSIISVVAVFFGTFNWKGRTYKV